MQLNSHGLMRYLLIHDRVLEASRFELGGVDAGRCWNCWWGSTTSRGPGEPEVQV